MNKKPLPHATYRFVATPDRAAGEAVHRDDEGRQVARPGRHTLHGPQEHERAQADTTAPSTDLQRSVGPKRRLAIGGRPAVDYRADGGVVVSLRPSILATISIRTETLRTVLQFIVYRLFTGCLLTIFVFRYR